MLTHVPNVEVACHLVKQFKYSTQEARYIKNKMLVEIIIEDVRKFERYRISFILQLC